MRRWGVVIGALTAALGIGACGAAAHARARTAHAKPAAQTVTVSYDGQDCAPTWSTLRAGPYEFAIQDRAQDVISMQLVNAADGEDLGADTAVQPGDTVDVAATLAPGGSYQWQCETPSQPPVNSVTIHVRGAAGATPSSTQAGITIEDLYTPYDDYIAYAEARLATLRRQLSGLDRQLAAGDRRAGESAWLTAHLTWLSIGQDDDAYGAFGELGNAIDGTAAGDVGGVHSPSFTGFHRVELDLWGGRPLRSAARDAAELTRLVDSIDQTTITADLPTTTAAVDAWVLRAHEILEDALRDTLSGDDDYGSHTGLAAIGADVSATREMLTLLGGLIRPRSPGLLRTATAQLDTLDETLAALQGRGRARTAPGALPTRERERLDGEVGAALETLAPVSELAQITKASS